MNLSIDNLQPVEHQIIIEKKERKTDSGIYLSDKKGKFIQGTVKKVGNKCKYRKKGDIVFVLKSRVQSLSVSDLYILDERDSIIDE